MIVYMRCAIFLISLSKQSKNVQPAAVIPSNIYNSAWSIQSFVVYDNLLSLHAGSLPGKGVHRPFPSSLSFSSYKHVERDRLCLQRKDTIRM